MAAPLKSVEGSDRDERDADICRRYLTGETLQSIGDSYGLSRQRIEQIIQQAGIWRQSAIKPSERDEFVGIVVPKPLKDALQDEAETRNTSMSQVIIEAFTKALEDKS